MVRVKLYFETRIDIISSIDLSTAIERVIKTFQDYPDLIQGFSVFLPPGYQIDHLSQDPAIIEVIDPSGGLKRITVPAKL
jgi:histone deacetylase complex regulatory component SIN3